MRLLDEHWIVFPTFVTGGLTWYERKKLNFFPGYKVRQFDTLFTASDPDLRRSWLAQRGLTPGGYVLFVPGGRGEAARLAEPAELFIAAARAFAEQTGQRAVVLTGRRQIVDDPDPRVLLLPRIEPVEVQHLMAEALLVVGNGGTSMVHTLAHGRPMVAVPLASDQDRRIRRAVRLGIADSAPRDAALIGAAAVSLSRDTQRREAMARSIAAQGLTNGLSAAVEALRRLAREAQVGNPRCRAER